MKVAVDHGSRRRVRRQEKEALPKHEVERKEYNAIHRGEKSGGGEEKCQRKSIIE